MKISSIVSTRSTPARARAASVTESEPGYKSIRRWNIDIKYHYNSVRRDIVASEWLEVNQTYACQKFIIRYVTTHLKQADHVPASVPVCDAAALAAAAVRPALMTMTGLLSETICDIDTRIAYRQIGYCTYQHGQLKGIHVHFRCSPCRWRRIQCMDPDRRSLEDLPT